jgi:hypothetical protein
VKPSDAGEAIARNPHGETLSAGAPSDADLEAAIVAAMLDGRGAVAEMLTETLKARKLARAGIVDLGARREGRTS